MSKNKTVQLLNPDSQSKPSQESEGFTLEKDKDFVSKLLSLRLAFSEITVDATRN